MMDSEKKKKLESSFDRILDVGFCLKPYEDLSDIIDPNPVVFGTTKDERIFSIEGVDELFKSQFEQMGNLQPGLDRKRIALRISPDENSAYIIEEITLSLSSPEEVNTIFMRASCVMEYRDDVWKLIHWHTSTPVDTENDHWHQEEWKREKEKLQKLVDQQTADLQGKNRELEIEASIERVRAVAMSMDKPEDMLKVCRTISEQLEQFGVEHIRNVQTVIFNEEYGTYQNYQYFAPYDKESYEITDSDKNPSVYAMTERMLESPDAFFTGTLTGKELADFRAYRKKEDQFPDPLLDQTEAADYHFFSIGPGGLGITLYRPLNEEGLMIFKRFHNVFSLAYRRFRDIEKAEAQAREAQIELSLERIRAQVTAMQESSDLLDIVVTMRTEFVNLGHEAHYFWHMRWLPDTYQKAMTSGDGSRIGMVMSLPRHIHGDIEPVAEWEKSDDPTYVLAMETDLAVDYVDKMISLGDFEQVDPQAPTLDDIRHIGGLTFVMARTTHGEIGYSLPGVVPDPPKDAVDTLVRFAGVFDLAYRRFEDLKKAEAQARENRIELALERVRARTMAMQESEELAEVATVLFEQLRELGGNLWGTGFGLCEENADEDEFWFANENGVFPAVSIPNTADPAHKKMYKGWKDGQEILSLEGSGKELKKHYEYMMSLPEVEPFFQKILDEGLSFPDWQQWNAAYFSHGYLLIITLQPYPDPDILKRFAKVFDQTYTRFLDLQKAEEQARESEIQLALERVRSRSMAMHKSEELADLSLELVKQVQALGIETWFCAFNIYDDHPDGSLEWGSNGQGTFPKYRTPREGVFLRYYEAGQRGEKLLVNEITEEECPAHYDYLCSLPGVGEQLLKIKDEGIPFPTYQIDHAAFFKYGYILFITFEPVPEAHNIFKRFAKVFEQSYTRFLDLQKAEAQAREAKIEAALERVRARSMGMQKSDDLIEVVREIGKGIHELGIQLHYSQIYTDYTFDTKTGLNIWVDVEGQDYLEKFQLPYIDHSITSAYYDALNEGLDYFSDRYSKAEKDSYFKLLFKYSDLKRIPKKRKELILNASGWTRFTVILDEATLNFGRYSLDEFTDEDHEIFIRFAKVFGQAYTRFLDLQKAEEQVREAEIQLALERVRAKTMAMKTQTDLFGVVELFGDQLDAVGVRFDDVTIIDGPITKNRDWELWSHIPGKDGFTRKVHIPYIDTPYFTKTAESVEEYEKTGNPIQVKSFTKNEKDEFLDHYFKHAPAIPDEINDLIYANPGSVIVDAFLKEVTVSLVRNDIEPFTDEDLEIFERFSKEFRQTYIRFLDIQKAEKQAREAQIEAALERVRSQSMGMQTSEDLSDVASEMFDQMKNLGGELFAFGIVLCDKEKDTVEQWHNLGNEGMMSPFTVPVDLDYIHRYRYDQWKAGEELFSIEIPEDYIQEHFDLMFKLPSVKSAMDSVAAEGIDIEIPNWEIDYGASFTHGYLLVSSRKPFDESHIFPRFAKVFNQAYTRFLDLQKAEEQAREAQIEAALERVRSRSLAMQKTNELQDVVRVVAEELKNTGVILDTGGAVICTYFQDSKDVIHWTATDDPAHPSVPYLLPYFEDELYDEAWVSKNKGDNYFAKEFSYDVKNAFFSHAFEHSDYRQLPEEYKKAILESKSHGIAWAWSENSAIMIPSLHGDLPSEEEKKILIRFAKVFEQSFIRFLDLKKAEEQAREAKIEAALEKVRSRSMGMQSSDELPEVANLLFLEVQGLGIPAWSCGYNILNEDQKTAEAWMSSEGALQEPFKLRLYGEASFDEMGEFILSDDELLVQKLGGKALEEHYEHMKSFPDLRPTFENIESKGLSLPTYQINHLCKFSHGFLLFITYEPVPDAHDIFRRFTKAFDQTYTRFLDLKKAEKQARESRIEAALERIRSRALAMQTSDELKEVALELRTQMGLLGQKNLEVCAIHLYDLHPDHFESWGAMHTPGSDDEILQSMVLIPKSGSLIVDEMMDYYASDQSDYVLVNEGEKSKQWFQLMKEHAPEIFRHLSRAVADIPADKMKAYWAMSEFSGGALIMVTYSYPDEDSRNLLRRTAKVFGLAYKRFKDLKRAEEQAREAQIENALEKVRSRSLAMQTPDELVDVVQLLRDEMGNLGVEELETSSIFIHDKESDTTQCWFTIKNSEDPDKAVTDRIIINLKDTWVGSQMDQFYRSSDQQASILMKGKHRTEWIRYCEERSEHFETSGFYGDSIPDRTYHLYKFSTGFLGAASPGEISDESWDLLRRATAVFSFAYTRFRDLQKAEESARRARQQASLDRVRADISSMRSADDLNRITPLIWQELTNLGIPFIRCGVFIVYQEKEIVEVYLSKPDGTSLAVMHLPFNTNELTVQTVDAWKNKKVFKKHWTREEFLEWGRSMMEQGQVQDLETYRGAEEAPESLHLHFIPFNQGMLYVGSTHSLGEKDLSLASSLADAFSIAYARYDDFVKLEKAKAGIEKALNDLKATQEQLVQQEKLASLGQLTAGIAHEIKNPLNFVNNFSDLSIELVKEAREELLSAQSDSDSCASEKAKVKRQKAEGKSKTGDGRRETDQNPLSRGESSTEGDARGVSGEAQNLSIALEILDDIEANLKTIHKHGTRADGIVKSMLQHSRGGEGKLEPTDLNALVKEYVNLSFHGMRAGKEPINVDIQLDLDESVGDVPLITEDFSRVLLNMCNNAFDAMREKEKLSEKSPRQPTDGKDGEAVQGDDAELNYSPKLSIRTKSSSNNVTIEIEDNGPGIPDEIKDKILQPFFTTKKGTQGTGLGLSITNDIIKAHGGKLKIISQQNTGTSFRIELPRH